MKDVFVKFPHGGLLKVSNSKKEKKDDQKHSLASFRMNEWKIAVVAVHSVEISRFFYHSDFT